ncbi:MAG: 23S rRNA pseudouridine 1911/1915/1917 synthase [Chloroflexi bacterium]|nr:MAG: 23S rRNA pseudouridine 1911/1915/1917 synthase [Chloroflexota bacterium]
MNGEHRDFLALEEEARLDRFLTDRCPDLSRSQLQDLMRRDLVTLNGKPARPSHKVRPEDVITVVIPPPLPVDLIAEDIPLSVVYQDSDLLVVDKPAGLTVHPAPGHPTGTLVNALLALCPDLQGIGGETRPGIVHRLDKDTSGLIMVAKNQMAHISLSAQLKQREVEKGYLALVWGHPPESGVVDAPIARDPGYRKRMAVVAGGRDSLTRYKVLEDIGPFALVEAAPRTGRTHQIRVHMTHLGHPLVGDALYSRRPRLVPRHFLHAFRLSFRQPSSSKWMEFESPLPPDLAEALEEFRAEDAGNAAAGGGKSRAQ